MLFLYILLTVYIIAVNFYGYRFVKLQRDSVDAGEPPAGDGRLFLAALFGGAIAIYASLFAMRYRLSSFILMIGLPLLAVFNLYCFFAAYRSIWLFL
ncbi:MAG: hypothetical protein IKD43_02800 [Clostridia bacterium]|nr:hypothetical protein [Clostridia bacterium]